MSAEQPNHAPAKTGSRRGFWRGGILPEALGLGFVGVALAGLAAAYLVCDHTWQQEAVNAQRLETEALARVWARVLGQNTDGDERATDTFGQGLSDFPRVCGVRWTAPDGTVRFAWPRNLAPVPGLPDLAARAVAGGSAPVVATAPVTGRDGTSLGTLRVEREVSAAGRRAFLLITWGGGAGVILLAFAVFYQRLRRHLRPVAAIERSLQSYADGIEKELLTLTLSDSLGGVARGWNQLIEQLADLQQQQQSGHVGGAAGDVLTRFENAVFRRVLDRLPFGVLCVTPEQRVSYANAAAAALLGRTPNDLIDRPVSKAISNPAVVQVVAGVQARSGAALSIDQTSGEGEHETTLRFRVLPMPAAPAGGDAVVTVEDISQLRESQRARDNFLYHVTHELRTPLTNIHAYAETLTQPGFDDEQTRKECYNVLISETRRLSRLVEDILSISQLEVGTARLNVGEVDLARLVRQMVQDNLGSADEKKIDLTLALPPKVPKIKGDKQRLSVLLNNLIGNAIKYTRENGKVHVNVEVEGHRLLIAVVDTGIGIAPEDQPHVFDKFYRAADDAVQMIPGTGLGLALAREVARLHGGEILVESERGKGSKFTVELPVTAGERAEVNER
jgi:signal transduction histidine kinase